MPEQQGSADRDTGPEHQEEREPERQGAGEADQAADAPAEDPTRRLFREALERKQRAQHASAEGAAHDGAEKSHGATGPTKARTFRRKSG